MLGQRPEARWRLKLGDFGVRDAVKHTHALLTGLMRHEHAPLALAQRASQVAAPSPVFTSLLNYRHGRRGSTSVDAASAWEGIEFLGAEERTNYPLSMSVDDLGQAFSLTAHCVAGVDPLSDPRT